MTPLAWPSRTVSARAEKGTGGGLRTAPRPASLAAGEQGLRRSASRVARREGPARGAQARLVVRGGPSWLFGNPAWRSGTQDVIRAAIIALLGLAREATVGRHRTRLFLSRPGESRIAAGLDDPSRRSRTDVPYQL